MPRTIAASGAGIDKILGEFDRQVTHLGLDRLATCLLALMDPGTGTCTTASAGHLPPAAVRPDGSIKVWWLPAGPPIGTGLGGYESLTVRMDRGTRGCSTPTAWWNDAAQTSNTRCRRLRR
ncbi:SpoIIE family protein phosphatase [Streptomyces filipinensis]|uniref:SpoIIE family protein phosphatase n=1 Tax=Streptomyces filipinensis TaxID=66887 RepID=UPI003570975D